MNKELIELQRKSDATGVVILDDDIKKLEQVLTMDAGILDKYLYFKKDSKVIFAEKLDEMTSSLNPVYFVIRNIDEVSFTNQERFVGLVKDREFLGYHFPRNVIIVFTVKSKDSLKNICSELYHFLVVAF